MCRGKNHGSRRCSTDNSEARRRRREAKKAREAHIPRVAGRGSLVVPWEGLSTMPAMKAEMAEVAELLKEDLNLHPDDPAQKAKDAALEIRLTRLGLAIGEEIERRAEFSLAGYQRQRKALAVKLNRAEDNLSAYWGELNAKRDEWKGLSEKESAREYNKMERYRKRLANKAWDLRDEDTELTRQYARKLSEAGISVLSELRPLGGTVAVHEETAPEAVRVISQTVARHFPSEWIKASNEGGPLIVSMSLDRAHYTSASKNTLYSAEGYPAKTAFLTDNQENLVGMMARLNSDGHDPSIHIVDTPELEAGERINMVSMALRVPFNPAKDRMQPDGTPEGEGWKYGHYVNETGVSEDKVWYRNSYHDNKTVSLARMVIPKDTFENSREKTTYHEFAHRAEDVVPNHAITRMENSFLNRRTTTKAGVQEELSLIYRQMDESYEPSLSDEVGRRGSFMTHYVGKYYLTSRSKEVLSTGIETLFGGAYGSFVGLDGYKRDIDHRGFVLGVLATA